MISKQGQGGPPLVLSIADFNADERAVFAQLKSAFPSEVKISDIAKPFEARLDSVGTDQRKARANSRVRNALRRLVRAGFVEKGERGSYVATVDHASDDVEFTTELVVRKVQDMFPELDGESHEFKAAMIAVAVYEVGKSDSRIAALTGLSRGYVIPRLRKLNGTPLASANRLTAKLVKRAMKSIAQTTPVPTAERTDGHQ